MGVPAGWAAPLHVVIRDPGSFHPELWKWCNPFHSHPMGCNCHMGMADCKAIWEMWSCCCFQGEEELHLITN